MNKEISYKNNKNTINIFYLNINLILCINYNLFRSII